MRSDIIRMLGTDLKWWLKKKQSALIRIRRDPLNGNFYLRPPLHKMVFVIFIWTTGLSSCRKKLQYAVKIK